MRLRIMYLAWCAMAGLLVGCGAESLDPSGAAKPLVMVSAPIADPTVAANRHGGSSAASGQAYVSMSPGTAPGGTSAVIRNGESGPELPIAMLDGGFDPVPIRADADDSLVIRVHVVGRPVVSFAKVPRRSRPIVVRTTPANRRTDVVLNPVIHVVFNEPMKGASLTTGIRLLKAGSEIAATVTPLASGGDTLAALLRPAIQLESFTEYQIVISATSASIAGIPLAHDVASTFTTGTGVLGGATELGVAPAVLDFGVRRIGVFDPGHTVTFTNRGSRPSGPLTPSIGGTNPQDFQVLLEGCIGQSLAPAESCEVLLRLRTRTPGDRTARYTVSDAYGSSATVGLSGVGGNVVISAESRADFGSTMAGTTATASIIIRNTGNLRSEPVGANVWCELFNWGMCMQPTYFTPTSTCGAIDAGASCELRVTFGPYNVGEFQDVFLIGESGDSVAAVTLVGTATGLVAPTIVAFPTTGTNVATAPESVRLWNSGNLATGPLATRLQPNNGGFEIVSNSCEGTSLSPGGDCSITVRALARASRGQFWAALIVGGLLGGTETIQLVATVQ